MSELMHVNVIAMLSLQVSRRRPRFHSRKWHIYHGKAVQRREETFCTLVQRLGADSLLKNKYTINKPHSLKAWKPLEPQLQHSGA